MKYIFVPEKLDLEAVIDSDPIDVHVDRIYLIIYKYFQAYLFDRYARLKDGFVYIHAYRFKELSADYKKIIDWLEKHEIIEINKSYTKSLYPRAYKLNTEYLGGIRAYELSDKAAISATSKNISALDDKTRRKYKSLWRDFASGNLKFQEGSEKVLIDLYKQNKEIKSKEEALINHCLLQMSMHKIELDQLWFYQDNKGNRLHTNLTNLKSELRENLRFKNEQLVEIDIVNSQPYFSINIIKEYFQLIMIQKSVENLKNKGIECDIDHYVNITLDGSLYDFFEDKYIQKYGSRAIAEHIESEYQKRQYWVTVKAGSGTVGYGTRGFRPSTTGKSAYVPADLRGLSNRKVVKAMIFNVLYGDLQSPQLNKHKKLFRELFPSVWEVLLQIKASNKNFAVELQKAESEAILNRVIPKIKKHNYRIPLFTIHDCIVTTKSYAEFVEKTTFEELTAFTGNEPKLSMKTWK